MNCSATIFQTAGCVPVKDVGRALPTASIVVAGSARPTFLRVPSTLCIALLTGCVQQPKQSANREEMREVWQHPGSGGSVAHPTSVTVAQGPSPLIYQVQQAGVLHVTDTTSGAELASSVVGPGTIVWVDQDKGVFANKQKLRPGPLPGGHQYSMSLDIDSADNWRAGVEAPRPALLPATRPANEPGH